MCLSDNFSHEFLLQEVLILKFLAYLLNKKKSNVRRNSDPLNSHTLRLYFKVGIQMPKKIFLRCYRWWENFSTEFTYSTLIQFRVCISLCQQIIVSRLPNELKETENDYCCGLHYAVVCIDKLKTPASLNQVSFTPVWPETLTREFSFKKSKIGL